MQGGKRMNIYVARQPIFDRRMNVYGYELLYRKSMNNYYEGTDDNQATAELIVNSFLANSFDELTEGKRAFINFSENMLLREIPMLLPKQAIVVEVLERVNPTEDIFNVCKKLNEAGYILALDDFVYDEAYDEIIEQAKIIKIEFSNVDFKLQKDLIAKYKGRIKFLAERVETRSEFNMAKNMGYDYFQGYFFSKPIMVTGNDIPEINTNLIRVLQELNAIHPDYQKMASIVETDVGLSYKLFKMANSVYFGARKPITSIRDALVRLGVEEIRKWIYLMMLKNNQKAENKELIKLSLMRAKMMELLSKEVGIKNMDQEYFITGLFSSIDVLLNRSMKEILEELSFSEQVKKALLESGSELRTYLTMVMSYENADWEHFEDLQNQFKIDKDRFMELYLQALQWVLQLEADFAT